jgi:hypothetical protein
MYRRISAGTTFNTPSTQTDRHLVLIEFINAFNETFGATLPIKGTYNQLMEPFNLATDILNSKGGIDLINSNRLKN